MWELGLMGGVFFPAADHQLYQPATGRAGYQGYKTAGALGLRFAYFPACFLGLEAEAAALPGEAEDGSSAGLWAARAHVIGQLPLSTVVPFLLVGGGALGASSDTMGNDGDGAFHFGGGVKASLDEHVLVRLDLRDTLSRQVNTDSGLVHSPEVLLGFSFVFPRTRPDQDGDGRLDQRDDCPAHPAVTADGCPAELSLTTEPSASAEAAEAAASAEDAAPAAPAEDAAPRAPAEDAAPAAPAESAAPTAPTP